MEWEWVVPSPLDDSDLGFRPILDEKNIIGGI